MSRSKTLPPGVYDLCPVCFSPVPEGDRACVACGYPLGYFTGLEIAMNEDLDLDLEEIVIGD